MSKVRIKSAEIQVPDSIKGFKSDLDMITFSQEFKALCDRFEVYAPVLQGSVVLHSGADYIKISIQAA